MFGGHVDTTRIGLVGHSAGGNGVAALGDLDGVKAIIATSADAATTGANFTSTLYLGGTTDAVVPFASVSDGYAKTPTRSHKRLVGITGAGHTGVTALFGIRNGAGQSIVDVAKADGVLTGTLLSFADYLFDCAKNATPQAEVIPIVNYATASVLEETLQCDPAGALAIEGIQAKFAKIAQYKHAP